MLLKNKPPIKGSVSYYDNMGTPYTENFQIDVENYSEVYLIPTEIEDLQNEVSNLSKEIERLCTSLDKINQISK